MSATPARRPDALRRRAAVFAALGDATRLSVLAKLGDGEPQSIARLTDGTRVSRQAVTKHLRVLSDAGMVRSARRGRESLFRLDPHPLAEARAYLDHVSQEWDAALARLQAHVEGEGRDGGEMQRV